jgi:hypothetical protein
LNNAPKRVVVEAEIAVNQAVSRCDDLPPRNLRHRRLNIDWNVARSLADQFEIAQCRVLCERARDETILIHTVRVSHHALRELQHVADIQTPRALRQEFDPFRRTA